MIVVRLKGGLGNQLFQYAAGYALAKSRGQRLELDFAQTHGMTNHGTRLNLLSLDDSVRLSASGLPSWVKAGRNKYLNKTARLVGGGSLRLGSWTYFLESAQEYHPEVSGIASENAYLDGYWQTERYFGGCREDLVEQLRPAYKPEPEYLEALERVSSCCSVAIHSRRGDFSRSRSPFHYLLEADYYRKAMSYVRERVDAPRFFWFSNDADWVRSEFGGEGDFELVRLSTAHPDVDELTLMSRCRHIITANSTFSWWAAWLNEDADALRITPSRPYGNDDMVPATWTRL